MAKVMGGTVGVESELGRGSAFWVELPLTVEGSQAASPRAPAAAAVALIGRPRVLVAEDNEVNRRVALRMLEKLGCEVDIAVNGSEAIERWESSAYDLLLMDCQMPGVDGYEAAAAIRQKEAGCARIPIVAVTAHAFSADEQRCYEAGMDGYIRKPIAAAELAAVVEKYAAREPQPACR